ncbi:MAG TPA: nucleotide sugar dehydrogenase [Aggregatilinea sp.]|jgi:UDP-N-acetyl-D-glucosamine dehydrogenase|uniref:nucleotide sugar dehydrogenase n=1 Tax=Aggregatilinea sp. TaxID=2806333 RepID=UPI002B768D77|nr:nucleotide sugar dehydrogenase [Aggregatilinea sp.]HML23668.1 nucleotide sugar dehydrogenase [Aggregatilinea sp.]
MDYKQQLLDRLHNRTATVGIVGMGYVGLPLAVEFARAGYRVVGLDLNPQKVDQLNAGVSYIPDVPTEELAPLVETGCLRATTSYADLAEADTVSICVPTPLRKTKDPDMSYVIDAATNVATICHAGMLVVLESTTYPGTTDEVVLPRLLKNGLTVGEDVFVAFSPERVDPGNPVYGVRNTPKVVGGVTPACVEVVTALYEPAVDHVVPVSSTAAAEMVKLLENTFRAVNIGLVNEMALMCNRLGVNVWEVIDAASTKPFGFMPFYPGPGLGGHCIPIDPLYLSWKLRALNYTARFIDLASEVNTQMPYHVVSMVMEALNDEGKALHGSTIGVLGMAYKRDIDDVRESPALDIYELLENKGAAVSFNDPFVASVRLSGERKASSVELTAEWLAAQDCVVIVTNHSAYDVDFILSHAKLVIDTRNATKGHTGTARIVRL